MSDVKKGLPVRTEDNANEFVSVNMFDPTTPSQGAGVDANGNLCVKSRTLDEDGNAYSPTNPLPVEVIEESEAGDCINDFNASANLAVDATENHDYTVTAGKNLFLKQVSGAASGRGKFEIQVETAAGSGTFNTLDVKFVTTANGNMTAKFLCHPEVGPGQIVRVIRTNRESDNMCLYSRIEGIERDV